MICMPLVTCNCAVCMFEVILHQVCTWVHV